MDTNRKPVPPWIVVALLLATYVGSYFALGTYVRITLVDGQTARELRDRVFTNQGMTDIYRPMFYVESKVRGKTLGVWHCYAIPGSMSAVPHNSRATL